MKIIKASRNRNFKSMA